MKATKLIPCLLAMAALPALASGTTAVPKRVGPVSYYGALHTSGGKIIGAKKQDLVPLNIKALEAGSDFIIKLT